MTSAVVAERTGLNPPETAGWRLAATPADYVLSDVRVVLPGQVTDRSTVVVQDGRIVDIVPRVVRGDVDGAGMLLLPGLVDVHSDALEKERMPRPATPLPLDFAIRSFDAKAAAAGITTIFHGAAFQRKVSDGVVRHPATAVELCRAIDAFRSDRVDHRVLHRVDIAGEEGVALVKERLDALPIGREPQLLSHEDHTPGQGQYADLDRYIEMIAQPGDDPAEVRRRVEERITEAESRAHIRAANLAWAGMEARAGRVRLVGHDPDTADAVEALAERGGAVAEFPTTLEAARRARELGLTIVAGAPNVLRGGSHSGNISAVELIAVGLVDALASDYLPSSLLAAVMSISREGLLELPAATALVTAGAAAAAGLSDRGRIAVGERADLLLVDDRGVWPRVITTLTATEVS